VCEVIWAITGPPGSGKTTLAQAIMATSRFGVHVPVDDLRLWVTSGLSDSVPWTEETDRQFRIAEESACSVARIYANNGFDVAIDHCRNPSRWNELTDAEFGGFTVRKVILLPSLDANLERNRARTNKDFDPSVLEDIIKFTNGHYRQEPLDGWTVIDNSELTIPQTLRLIGLPARDASR
jgi:predicted ABC-type ATPase